MWHKIVKITLLVSAFGGILNSAELLQANQKLYTNAQSAEFGFVELDEKGILHNPPSQKARIYVVRGKEFVGAKVDYEVLYQYEPNITPNIKGQNEPIIDENALKNNILCTIHNASKCFKDFEADKTLLLFAGLETNSYIVFTPQAGRIYCIQGSVILGLNQARPNLTLIDKASCERLYSGIK